MNKIEKELVILKKQKEDMFFAYDKKLINKEDFININSVIEEAIEFKEIELTLDKIENQFKNIPEEFIEMFPENFDLIEFEINECINFINSNNVEIKYKKEKLNKVNNLLLKSVEKFESMPFFITQQNI